MSAAFICPLYDVGKHFDFAVGLYRSKIKYRIEADLIFIFSNTSLLCNVKTVGLLIWSRRINLRKD